MFTRLSQLAQTRTPVVAASLIALTAACGPQDGAFETGDELSLGVKTQALDATAATVPAALS